MTTETDTTAGINRQRRQAVQLRLDGETISGITKQCGLSAPTIIAAHKAYLAGGWPAVESRARGRKPGDGKLPAISQAELSAALQKAMPESVDSAARLWSHRLANIWLEGQGFKLSDRAATSYFQRWGLNAANDLESLRASALQSDQDWLGKEYQEAVERAKESSATVVWAGVQHNTRHSYFYAHTLRKRMYWLSAYAPLSATQCIDFIDRLQQELGGHVVVIMKGIEIARVNQILHWLEQHVSNVTLIIPKVSNTQSNSLYPENPMNAPEHTEHRLQGLQSEPVRLTHLQRLEAESIHIMREVIAEADNPVMLYSVGKDSAVMLHLAMKAFYPALPPFPLLHVDTTWKFRAMYEFRDRIVKELGLELLTHTNPQGIAQGVNPFTHGSGIHTDIMKTEALKQALDKHGFDVAFGGARRDEEKSRAKERIFSFRSEQHRWEPKDQRPELWQQYNARKHNGESIRVFPLSNWTELDIWQYIHLEEIPIVPLYLSAERPVVERDGSLIMVDDDRMPLHEGEVPMMRKIRFRTLGCYPLTGAVESVATTIPGIIQEMLLARTSERQGRMIDHDSAASMEKKKQEGYF